MTKNGSFGFGRNHVLSFSYGFGYGGYGKHLVTAVSEKNSVGQPLQSSDVHTAIDSQLFTESRDFCLPHLHSKSPLWGSSWEYCNGVWYGKTIMLWLPDSEKIWYGRYTYLFRQSTNVTNRQRRTDTA